MMSDTPETAFLDKPIIKLDKVAVGTFANLGGQPVDYAKSAVLDRAGVPQGDDARAGLVYTHASAQGKAVPRLPAVFPPDELAEGRKLETAQDYLNLIAATPPEYAATPAEVKAVEDEVKALEDEVKAAAVQAEVSEQQAQNTQQNAAALASEQVQV